MQELQEETFENFKYQRIGHIDQGRLCDKIACYAFSAFPGEILPKRWIYKTPERFVSEHGGDFRWSITRNYHGLFLNGHYIFRIWTNTDTVYTWVDLVDHLLHPISLHADVVDIPNGSKHKCRPMTIRAKFIETEQVDLLKQVVRSMYGLDS